MNLGGLKESDLEAFAGPTVVINKTTFFIDKIGAMRAWAILEFIREALAKTAGLEMKGLGGSTEAAMLLSVLNLPAVFVDKLRRDLFEHVRFQSGESSPLELLGCEDMAFRGMEPIAIYEITLRSLCRNFMPSFAEITAVISAEPPADGSPLEPSP